MGEEQEAEKRSDFWMKVAGVTFGLWALAIPFGAVVIKDALKDASTQATSFQSHFNSYVLTMERRLTQIEEREAMMQKDIAKIDAFHQLVQQQPQPYRNGIK